MNLVKFLVIGAVVGLLAPACCVAAEGIRDGLWEVTTSMEMPGMPAKMKPTSMKHCYSKDDVKDQKKVVAGKNKDCSVSDYTVSGNKVTWKMKCTGQSAGTYSGETVFGKDSYNSIMKMKTQGHVMTMKMAGKRVGNCP